MKLIKEAYDVLGESEKRKEYDMIRVSEEETEESKEKWQKVDREDKGWESYKHRE